MADTVRHYLGGTARDGKPDWKTRIARDNRVTGLREQRRDRRETRNSLRVGDDDSVAAGKMRRYSNRYGSYEY